MFTGKVLKLKQGDYDCCWGLGSRQKSQLEKRDVGSKLRKNLKPINTVKQTVVIRAL